MVARCPKSLAIGVVTCTTGRAVGSVVTHAEEGAGSIATQAYTSVFYGIHGLKLLRMGFEPNKVLASSLALDPKPEFRQVLIIDSQGRTAAHTGGKTDDWKGHFQGENFVVGGNHIVGPVVLKTMVKIFEKLKREALHKRLIEAVKAGYEVGGSNLPDHTAALKVVGIKEELKLPWRPFIDLRVDSSDDPITELATIYENYKEWIKTKRAQRRDFLNGLKG